MSGKDNARAPAIRWMREPRFDEDGVQATAGIDDRGMEHPDPVPLAPPVGLAVVQGDPVKDALRRLMAEERMSFMAAVMAEGFEDEEEANDFDVREDMFPADPSIPWEGPFDFTEAQEYQEKAARAAAKAGATPPTAESKATAKPAEGVAGGEPKDVPPKAAP